MISHRYKFIFIHMGRTGGSALERMAGIGLTNDQRTAHLGNTDFPGKHKPLSYYFLNHPREFASYFKFTIVRNPFERIVSAWKWRTTVVHTHTCSFKEFVFSKPWSFENILSLDGIGFEDSIRHLDFIARFENLNEDIKKICNVTGMNFLKFMHTNKTRHRAYQEYYDSSTLEFATELFRTELDYFGYEF